MAFEGLSEKLNAVFKRLKGRGVLTEADVKEAMREVKMALLEADVSYKVVKDFIGKVTERAVGTDVLASLTPAQQVIKIVNEELIALMGNENARINYPSKPPCIIMMVGLQGSGKTTHAAKLAKYFKDQGKRPLLAACDVYRPAAIKQLETVGAQLGIPVFQMGQGDPVEIAKAGIAHAKKFGNDLVFLDTAGRLHNKVGLMNELTKIRNVMGKVIPNAPQEVMLVLDGSTGQNAFEQARQFTQATQVTSLTITKLDGTAKGGVVIGISDQFRIPVRYIGIGEGIDQLKMFDRKEFVNALFGSEAK